MTGNAYSLDALAMYSLLQSSKVNFLTTENAYSLDALAMYSLLQRSIVKLRPVAYVGSGRLLV